MAYNLLKGKKGIIFGALDEKSIAWLTAERVHEEGGQFVLTNAPIAMRMGKINDLAEKTGSQVIPADATSIEDITNQTFPFFRFHLFVEQRRFDVFVNRQLINQMISLEDKSHIVFMKFALLAFR